MAYAIGRERDRERAKGCDMTTQEALRLARKHLGKGDMESSARVALADAVALTNEGRNVDAVRRALRSLDYSVGVGHADRVKVAKLFDRMTA